MGTLFPGASGGASWSASCYQNTSASLSLTANGGVVTFTASDPSSLLCDDMYILVTAYKTYFMDLSTLSASRTVTIDAWAPNELVRGRLTCAFRGNGRHALKWSGVGLGPIRFVLQTNERVL